jgi:hypothetical protein
MAYFLSNFVTSDNETNSIGLYTQDTSCVFNHNVFNLIDKTRRSSSVPLYDISGNRLSSRIDRAVIPPAPRLVCIETNPGPPKNNKSKQKNNQLVLHVGSTRGGKRKHKHNSRTKNFNGISPNLTAEYFRSLVNPFDCPGVYLGWGCMVPSTIVSGYLRTSFTANADGSFACAALPCTTTPCLTWTGGAGSVAPVGFTSLTNAASIIANASEGRVISVGIRAYPDIALTSVPGAVYSGALVPVDFVDINALTVNDFVAFPTSHMTIGTKGSSSTGRPIDPSSFVFSLPPVDGVGYAGAAENAVDIPFSIPYIAFLGLPASAIVYVELCINFEVTTKVGHSASSIIPGGGNTTSKTLADTWSTFEQMWGHVKGFLPPPGRPGESLASSDSTLLGSILSGSGAIAGRYLLGPGGSKIGSNIGSMIGNFGSQGSGQGYQQQYRQLLS